MNRATVDRLRQTVEELTEAETPHRFIWTKYACEPNPEDMPATGPGILFIFPCARTDPHSHEHPDPHEDRPPGVDEVVWIPPDADEGEVAAVIRQANEGELTVHQATDPRARRGGGHRGG